MATIKAKKNALIKAFDDSFWVIQHDGGYCLYDKKRYCKRANAQYLGKFYINNDGTKYVFRDEYYTDKGGLIKAMDKYNAKLPFSAEIYDPTYRKNYQIEMAVYDYLLSLGFKRIGQKGVYNNMFELCDAYNQKICTIELITNEDTYTGVVRRLVYQAAYDYRIIEVPFKDMDSAIGACNSLLASYTSILNLQMLNIFKNMTDARASIMLDETFDMKKFSVDTKDARQMAIDYLESELKRLKGE